MSSHEDVITAREAARARQPIGYALQDTLGAAVDAALDPADRDRLERALVGLGAHLASQQADVTEAEALAYLADLGLLEPGLELYGVIVDHERVGVIAARNRFHAVAKARKDYGLHVAEYRRVDTRHEIHGARPKPMRADMTEAEAFRGLVEAPEAVPVPAPRVEHEIYTEHREHPQWPMRAACTCGWRGSWHRDRDGTLIAERAHAKAVGLEG